MMDKIVMKNMQFHGTHGVFEEEKVHGQIFIVNVVMHLNLSEACKSDQVEDTVSYAEVFEHVRFIMEEMCFDLVERVAEEISDRILKNFKNINEVKVCVEKPQAPVKGVFESFGVEICRKRQPI
jgi:dihydroneopterin aldolase